jgi:hypothetical protein
LAIELTVLAEGLADAEPLLGEPLLEDDPPPHAEATSATSENTTAVPQSLPVWRIFIPTSAALHDSDD